MEALQKAAKETNKKNKKKSKKEKERERRERGRAEELEREREKERLAEETRVSMTDCVTASVISRVISNDMHDVI